LGYCIKCYRVGHTFLVQVPRMVWCFGCDNFRQKKHQDFIIFFYINQQFKFFISIYCILSGDGLFNTTFRKAFLWVSYDSFTNNERTITICFMKYFVYKCVNSVSECFGPTAHYKKNKYAIVKNNAKQSVGPRKVQMLLLRQNADKK